MKTVVSVPDSVFERAESAARLLGVSRSELYSAALLAFLEEHAAATQRQALDELFTTESSELPAGADKAQARIASEWEA